MKEFNEHNFIDNEVNGNQEEVFENKYEADTLVNVSNEINAEQFNSDNNQDTASSLLEKSEIAVQDEDQELYLTDSALSNELEILEEKEIITTKVEEIVNNEIESNLNDEVVTLSTPFQDYYFASLSRRFIALLIDNIVIQAIYWIIMGDWLMNNLLEYVIVVVVYCGYFALMTYYFKGQTLGKMIVGVRTVRLDGNYLTLQDVLLREVAVRSIHRIFGFLYLISFFSKERKQLGDFIADTCVIKDRG